MRKIILLNMLVFLISPVLKGQDGNTHDPLHSTSPKKERKLIIVEERPEYPGGFTKFYEYIDKNLKYPKTAKRNNVSGKIFVEFAIDSTGIIDDESVRTVAEKELNELGWTTHDLIVNKDCELEAIRLLKECSDWEPAMQKGKPVSVVLIVPITFEL